MKSYFKILVTLFCIILFGCAYNQGVIQKDDVSYLKLTGNLNKISLQIDEDAIIELTNFNNKTVYEIKPGVHIVTIRRDNKVIVERKLYFNNQTTREVNVK